MPLTKIKSLGITDGTIVGDDINSTFNLTGKTVTLPAGTGGKILQVLSATDSTERSTTSTSFVTASNTMSVSITPSSASNKILVLYTTTGSNGANHQIFTTVYRGATNLGTANGFTQSYNGTDFTTVTHSTCYLDSPATTSSTTYQVYVRVSSSTGYLNRDAVRGSITVMEIAG